MLLANSSIVSTLFFVEISSNHLDFGSFCINLKVRSELGYFMGIFSSYPNSSFQMASFSKSDHTLKIVGAISSGSLLNFQADKILIAGNCVVDGVLIYDNIVGRKSKAFKLKLSFCNILRESTVTFPFGIFSKRSLILLPRSEGANSQLI